MPRPASLRGPFSRRDGVEVASATLGQLGYALPRDAGGLSGCRQSRDLASESMPEWLSLAIYCAAVLIAVFFVSGVAPRYRRTVERLRRVELFAQNYIALLEGDRNKRGWLAARADEMQADAQSVGRGVTYVAPPPMLGGGAYTPHQMFSDLFNRQSYTDNVTDALRLEVIAGVQHQLQRRVEQRRRELRNPLAWLRIAFERLVRFPRYLLRQAGFSKRVTDSSLTRAVTVAWSLIVGAATIGAFVVGLLALRK